MTDYTRKPSGHDCDPPEYPADQPNPPGGKCEPLPSPTPPTLEPPRKCDDPPRHCNCPHPPGNNSNCLEKLIDEQTQQMAVGDKATALKKELTDLLTKAMDSSKDYTRENYDNAVKRWVEEDERIVRLLDRLKCEVPCWECIFECYVCPLLYELRYAEQWLYGDGTLYTDVHNLYDLRYWHERDLDTKDRTLKRIKSVLNVWMGKPGKKINETLDANLALIKALEAKSFVTETSKILFDLLLKLVPRHLAIAPPKGSNWSTNISKEFTDFCLCDQGKPDVCCGPDTGELSLRQRVMGAPLPYLIDPKDYYTVVCCLVEQRWWSAEKAVAEARAAYQKRDAEITRRKTQLETVIGSPDKPGTFEKDALGAMPAVIDCRDCEPRDNHPNQSQRR